MTNLASCFSSVTDDILNVSGTSTDSDGIFTEDLDDPNSAMFKQLQEDFCAKVSLEIVDLFINDVISSQFLRKLSWILQQKNMHVTKPSGSSDILLNHEYPPPP